MATTRNPRETESGRIMLKLKNCPSCYGSDVSSTFQGAAMRFVVCNACGVRGPVEGDSEKAERGWNGMPRDPEPMTLSQAVGILNDRGHMSTSRWHIARPYGYAMASSGICNLTELQARGIAREYLIGINQRLRGANDANGQDPANPND